MKELPQRCDGIYDRISQNQYILKDYNLPLYKVLIIIIHSC